jgi:hypothetical protein
MTQTTIFAPLQEAQLDDPRERILLPPSDPNAEVIEIPGYKLVYVNDWGDISAYYPLV